jgi:hypothetical protein
MRDISRLYLHLCMRPLPLSTGLHLIDLKRVLAKCILKLKLVVEVSIAPQQEW